MAISKPILVLSFLLGSLIVIVRVHGEEHHKPVAIVQGSVYCKACENIGTDSLEGASPIEGAVVRLSCKNADQTSLVQEAKTNTKGNFLIKKPKQLSPEQLVACKVYLVSSSEQNSCNKPTDLNFGISGSTLTQMQKIATKKTLKYDYFTIKPFAFESSANESCQVQKEESSYEIDEVICNPQCVLINYGCYC